MNQPFEAPGFDAALAQLRACGAEAEGVLAAAVRVHGATVVGDAGGDEVDGDATTVPPELTLLVAAASGERPIDEPLILALHAQACADQESFLMRVDGPGGKADWQERPLAKGVFKSSPNNSMNRPHVYAPVDQTADEMRRLIAELGSPAFAAAHPAVQAAYAHHSLVSIHPFADGNGRVARALAAICLERATGLPLLLDLGAAQGDADRGAGKLQEGKRRYLDALAAADEGRYEVFSRFVAELAQETIRRLIPAFGGACGQEASSSSSGHAN